MNSAPCMVSRGREPIYTFDVNGTYILAIYQGGLSEFDLLLKYRKKDNGTKSGWSRIRTPKHIHWAVDVIIKMHEEPGQTKAFVGDLLSYWEKVEPIKTNRERGALLSKELIEEVNSESSRYRKLAGKGEYSVRFLLLIAKLLMVQEKTNLHTAFMFKKLLQALLDGKDIFKIVSIATHR